ncbi:MAG: TfoX/Sxy family protein [Thermoleophilia bacterium]
MTPRGPSTAEMRNIGPTSATWLAEVGIHTPEQLRRTGAVEAYRMVKAWRPWDVTLILLWALEGAIRDVDWMDVSPERRLELRREVEG